MNTLFYIFVFLALFFALGINFSPLPTYSILSAFISMFATCIVLLLINQELTAFIIILFYLAIAPLLIMYTLADNVKKEFIHPSRLIFILILISLLFFILISFFTKASQTIIPFNKMIDFTIISQLLFSKYIPVFIILIAFILVGVLGVIIITRKDKDLP